MAASAGNLQPTYFQVLFLFPFLLPDCQSCEPNILLSTSLSMADVAVASLFCSMPRRRIFLLSSSGKIYLSIKFSTWFYIYEWHMLHVCGIGVVFLCLNFIYQ